MIQTPALKQITLIGVGLIGGSFVLDLKRQGLVEKVVGIDLDADNLARALERKVIDEAFEEINTQSVGGADWVLIATPVATLPHICRQLAPLLSAPTIVSDVGSTKQSALAAFAEHLGAHLPRCVAAVSHMPHMLAYAYVHQIAEHPDGQTYLDFAASGFRDFTRIASSHPAIWTDICIANKDSLLYLLAGQQQALAYLQNLLQSNDADALYRYFEEAQHTRDDWQARQ